MVTPFATGVGGTFSSNWDLPEGNSTTLDRAAAEHPAGRSYINFHTVQFGGGEIRGNIVVQVPEPETYALMLAGLAVVAGMARQTRSKRAGSLGDLTGKRPRPANADRPNASVRTGRPCRRRRAPASTARSSAR